MTKIYSATLEQIDEIMAVYDRARDFMEQSGNPNQWVAGYPSRDLIMRDITDGNLYVGVNESGTVHFVFALMIGREPSYEIIEQGQWMNDDRYGTIHRIASDGKTDGVFRACLAFCKSKISNIRIDTHNDNKIMQHLIEKNGFQRCGIIHLRNGSARIAYQLQV